MSFGISVVTFRAMAEVGVPDSLGEFAEVAVDTLAPGCRHRPLSFTEAVTFNLDVATEYWRTTLPLFEYDTPTLAAIMGFNPGNPILVDGVGYEVVGGVRSHPDRFGTPYKATIISKRQFG